MRVERVLHWHATFDPPIIYHLAPEFWQIEIINILPVARSNGGAASRFLCTLKKLFMTYESASLRRCTQDRLLLLGKQEFQALATASVAHSVVSYFTRVSVHKRKPLSGLKSDSALCLCTPRL